MRKNPTSAEDALWELLRNRRFNGLKFRRQHAVDRFIVDFICPEVGLLIEVDGPIHSQTKEEDHIREDHLKALGLEVLRLSNEEVLKSPEVVLDRVEEFLSQRN